MALYRRPRHCSFCGEVKHNKRTCQNRKAQAKSYMEELGNSRKKLLANMKRNGFYIGAIFQYGTDEKPNVLFVREIRWESISSYNHYSIKVSRIEDFDTTHYVHFPTAWFEDENAGPLITDNWTSFKILNSVDVSNIENDIPDGWLEGTLGHLPMYLQ